MIQLCFLIIPKLVIHKIREIRIGLYSRKKKSVVTALQRSYIPPLFSAWLCRKTALLPEYKLFYQILNNCGMLDAWERAEITAATANRWSPMASEIQIEEVLLQR